MKRLLDGVQSSRSRLRQIAGEVAEECGLGQSPFVAIEHDTGRGGWRRKRAGQRRIVFSGIRRPRSNVDHGGDLWIDAGFGRDHAREGVRGEHGRAVLPRQHALGLCHCIVKCRQRVLHRGHSQPRGLQAWDDLGPGGPVGEQPVHQNDASSRKSAAGPRDPGIQRRRQRGREYGRERTTTHRHGQTFPVIPRHAKVQH